MAQNTDTAGMLFSSVRSSDGNIIRKLQYNPADAARHWRRSIRAASSDDSSIYLIEAEGYYWYRPASLIRFSKTIAENQAPIADAGVGIKLECRRYSYRLTLDASGSSDPNMHFLTYRWVGLGRDIVTERPVYTAYFRDLAVDTHTLALTVSDGALSGTDKILVQVDDTRPPRLDRPTDLVWPHTLPLPDMQVRAYDECDRSPALTNDAPAEFPLGTTQVTWTATDASGHQSTAMQTVTLLDIPVGSGARIGPEVTFSEGVSVGVNVTLRGRTRIGRGVVIGDGAVVYSSTLGEGSDIGAGAHLYDARIGANVRIGMGATVRGRIEDDVEIRDYASLGADWIGARSTIASGVRASYGLVVGTDVQIKSGASFESYVRLGDSVIVGPNV